MPDRGELSRLVLFAPETGARHVSAVLVRIPPGHEFALHTHPVSEDCFFVLAGSGEAFEPGRALPIASQCGVWIPAGHPHGLRAGTDGMLEIGFQAPPDPTAVPFAARQGAPPREGLLAVPLAGAAREPAGDPGFRSVFGAGIRARHLDARCAWLRARERVALQTGDAEVVVVVARGAVEQRGAPHCIESFSALRLDPFTQLELCAVRAPCLLLAIHARAAA